MKIQIFDTVGNILDCTISEHRDGDYLRHSFTYHGSENICVGRAMYESIAHGFLPDTKIYAEGYNMLSQTLGTISQPTDMTNYSDTGHYKLPTREGYFTAYSLLVAYAQPDYVMAFTSTYRFVGKIHFSATEIIAEQDLCGIEISPNQTITLEELYIAIGNANELMENVGNRLNHHHPIQSYPSHPLGWCSWYCFGPECTTENVKDNMAKAKDSFTFRKKTPFFIQIDDGYQAYMGDFLTISKFFPDFDGLITSIHDSSCEPAIWVAPFIAQKESELYNTHPEYFVMGEDGKPLSSDKCSFGGWREGPWYMIDGTNPAVLAHLKSLFATLRSKYGIKYFKLDANMWGALPFGKRFDNTKTYIEAYRDAMVAILEGAGEGSYILGCNAPMWASAGVVHGMRTSGDISRVFKNFKMLHEENSHRNWQNGKLWLNDPDCVVTINNDKHMVQPDGSIVEKSTSVTEDEFAFHRTAILATGGAILAGDDMCRMGDTQIGYIRKLLSAPKVSAVYDDYTHTLGRQTVDGGSIITLLQPLDEGKSICVKLKKSCDVYDFWTDELLHQSVSEFTVTLNAHDGKAYYAKEL